ncbi:hypothetical protein BGW80DRAFT_892458 [Lactifluus volemus]|nr:hypothetical protein BGW80DRAFT_892458 [Lactifluus volemus]
MLLHTPKPTRRLDHQECGSRLPCRLGWLCGAPNARIWFPRVPYDSDTTVFPVKARSKLFILRNLEQSVAFMLQGDSPEYPNTLLFLEGLSFSLVPMGISNHVDDIGTPIHCALADGAVQQRFGVAYSAEHLCGRCHWYLSNLNNTYRIC